MLTRTRDSLNKPPWMRRDGHETRSYRGARFPPSRERRASGELFRGFLDCSERCSLRWSRCWYSPTSHWRRKTTPAVSTKRVGLWRALRTRKTQPAPMRPCPARTTNSSTTTWKSPPSRPNRFASRLRRAAASGVASTATPSTERTSWGSGSGGSTLGRRGAGDGEVITNTPHFTIRGYTNHPLWRYNGVISERETGGQGQWTHQDYAQGSFSYCLGGRVGCVQSQYPYVDKTQYGNGKKRASGRY